MKHQIIEMLIGCTFALSTTTLQADFNYKYQIKSNSLNPLDVSTAYYYKEEMVDKYENFFFTLDSSSQIEFVSRNLNFFKLYDNVSIKNEGGTILITIGNGKGITINGQFRKNECDNQVINEKYYIFEMLK